MKYLKLFENHKNEEDIHRICEEYNITNYTINDDLSIDVDGNVYLYTKGLTKLPLIFNKVNGNFACYNNQLTSLEGAPKEVNGNFDCYSNNLTSLKGAPNKVNGNFDCTYNQLTSLEGAPKEVNGNFDCYNNNLTSLKGAPNKVNGNFDCTYNQLTSLEGATKEVNGYFNCSRNNLYSFYNLPIDVIGKVYYYDNPNECFENLVGQDSELIYEFNELYVIQKVDGIWSIYKHRMVEFVDMFETEQPDYDKIGKYYKILD
jgi:hypothetical protein